MLKLQTLLLRLVVLMIAVWGLIELVPPKLASIQLQSVKDNSAREQSYQKVLAWNERNNQALTNLAELALLEGEHKRSISYALQALSVDPTNGRAMAMLIPGFGKIQASKAADQAVELAPKLWSAHSYVRSTLADYWAGKGDVEKVLIEWDQLITRHPSLYKPIFPILHSYANSDESRHILTPYVTKPAAWWKDFFIFMVNNKTPLPVLEYFYQQRIQTDVPLEDKERNAYVSRLQQVRLWKLAYSSWIGGLSKEQFSLIGSVFDGGFEGRIHDTGFDWHFKQSRQAKITLGKTRGHIGKRALRIVFNKRKSINFRHVWQRLLLTPGQHYQLTMQARLDGLKNPQGLVWQVSCSDISTELLGQSEPLKGRKKWHEVSFEFEVPTEGCDAQIIRLEAASRYHHEQFFHGSVWFDQIEILPVIEEEDTQP